MNQTLRGRVPSIPKKQTERRRALTFAMSELDFRREMTEELGPATDNPEYAMWQVRALRFAISVLRKPHFPVSPLI